MGKMAKEIAGPGSESHHPDAKESLWCRTFNFSLLLVYLTEY